MAGAAVRGSDLVNHCRPAGRFVRGFSGFGSALIFMPLAGQFLPPLWCIMTLVAMDIFGPVPNLPRLP
mgnify:CR=1 FL=1